VVVSGRRRRRQAWHPSTANVLAKLAWIAISPVEEEASSTRPVRTQTGRACGIVRSLRESDGSRRLIRGVLDGPHGQLAYDGAVARAASRICGLFEVETPGPVNATARPGCTGALPLNHERTDAHPPGRHSGGAGTRRPRRGSCRPRSPAHRRRPRKPKPVLPP